MTKIKKIVAMALAFLMIFSSASVLANAWTVTVDDGFNLAIGTKFFINDGTEWVETEKVAPGDDVKARVYIGTDYYSNSSTLLFFYDKDFFTHSYTKGQNELSVNSEAGEFSGLLNPAPVLNSQVSAGYIDSAFLDEYAAISVNLFMADGAKNAMYDDSTWIFEFDLKVAETATGEGDLFVKDTTVQNSTSQNRALVNVPKGPADGTSADVWPMWRWNANVTLSSQPVSTLGSVTFNANNGKFADGEAEAVISGDIGDAVEVPAAPTRDGYTFIGWVDAADTTPTYEEAQSTVPVAEIPYEPVAYNAFWIKNVNITFNTDGGSEIPAHENVTPYTDFAAVEAPTKGGYTFVGWDVRGNMTLPEKYPNVDTEYTAIWAKNVTVSFDTNGADPIESIDGVAGESFDYEIAKPSKEGHWFAKWSPALPKVFPENDTTYKALFETNAYPVFYYVEGNLVSSINVEYGAEIPTAIGSAIAPEGMKLSAWYTDAAMTQEFATGTVMGTEKISLYAKYEYETYNAIFDANGGKFADGNDTVSVPTVYLESIEIPAAPTKAGYEFAGWAPYAGVLDEANDMTFYATWEEVERTVEYYSDGNLYETFNLNTGDEFDIPADAYKEGYTFKYWSETEGGAEAQLPATMPELETEEPLKYYAVFEINEYTITWDVDGETTEKTYKFDEAVENIANPTKTGYVFAGWADETGAVVTVPATMPANDVNLKATWTVETYVLKFNTDGGNEIGDIIVTYNEDITSKIPANPTKEGHTFTGWSETIPTVVPDLGENGAEKTFTATWDVDNYTVTWIVDGAEDVVTYAYGADIKVPAPTKTGYVFAGWDAEVPATMPAENLTFNGSWNPATDTKYTVNIHTMEADGQYTVATEVLEGTTESTANAVYTVEEGFELGENSVTSGTVAADGTLVLDVYLNRKTVTISFNTDGGSAVDAVSGLYGADVVVTKEPTKTGYKFEGWKDIPATFPATDIEVTAIWSAKTFDATFNANGGAFADGSAETKVPTVFNEAIVAPDAPTMKGHKFEGWTPSVDKMTEEGMSFTAVWTPVEYNAVFDANGGKFTDGSSTATVPTTFGEAIVAPAAPTRDGYIFSTWTPAVGSMTEEGMTFTAEWINATDTQYTVTVYTMNTDRTYGEGVTSTYAGETGAEAKAEGKYTIAEGFKLSDVKENKLSGTIVADGSLALVVYIDRIEYTFTVNVDGTKTTENYLYGAAVATPETPVKAGYTFAAWTPAVPATMPANNIEVVATWTKNTNTAYKVIVNYTDAQTGEAVATEKNYTGTTENAIAIVEAAGSAENTEYVLLSNLIPRHYQLDTNAANELTGVVAADGSTVLNVYLVPVKYTATFTTGDGAFADGSKSYKAELDYYSLVGDYAPAEEPTREGYSFGGWRNADVHIASDREFAAIWTINQYTFTVDVDGNVTETKYDFGAPVAAPEEPTKEGHKFEGWDGEVPATMPANNVTVKATWSKLSYTVTWVVDGAEDVVTYVYGADIEVPAPTKTGYVFAGWDGEVPATMPAENLTFNGSWNPATDTKYTVNIHTMEADGKYTVATEVLEGTTDSTVNAVYTVEEGFELGENSVTSGTVAADGTLVLDVYLNRKTVTISFNTDGGSAVDALTGLYGAAVGTPAETTKTGYTFAGWDSLPATFPAADTTVKAIWDINSYTITFNAGEGTFADGSKEKTAKFDYNTIPVAPETPVMVGYEFTGWTPDFAPVTGEATYTAQFAADAVDYTVETYIMDTEGNYGAPSTETKRGTADTTATVVPVEKAGFTVSDNSVLSGTIAADGSTVLKVYYDRNSYKITINGVTDEYYYGEEIPVPEVPEAPEGYEQDTENPWVDENGDPIELPITVGTDNPTEIKPNWSVLSFTVTFVVDGVEETKTLEYGAAIEVTKPVKEGYWFAGWKDETGAIVSVPATMPAKNLKFTAVFETTTYVINYYVDGVLVETFGSEYGETIRTELSTYEVPTGYSFDGWYTDAACKNKFVEGTTVSAAITELYAKTTANTYDAIFMVDGEVYDTVPTVFDTEIVAPKAPSKEGYIFAGWDKEVGLMDTEGKTFTATWDAAIYTVTYKAEGMNDEIFELAFGEELEVPADPYKEGWTFAGWALTEGGEAVELPATMPAENLTYYAVFSQSSYTVTWVIDGEETVDTLAVGAAIVAPEAVKDGFEFKGWALTEGGEVVELPTNMPAENLKYYAVFELATYTVTWVIDGEETVDTLAVGAAIVAPEAVKEGFEFKGWSLTADGELVTPETVMGTTNLKYYAVFEEEVAQLPIKLMPVEGETGVIERYGEIESYNDGYTVTTEGYETPEDFEEYYVYGFTGRRFRESDIENYFYVQGNGYMELEYSELSGEYGTGAKVIVKENGTDRIVEEFYVIIFGDVNGDSLIDVIDSALVTDEMVKQTWSNRRNGIKYRIKSADLDLTGGIDVIDSAALECVSNSGTMMIDQTTGFAY